MKKVTVLDLFSGSGGLTQGFVSAETGRTRFVPIQAVELDPFAAATYASNFGPHVFQGDIAEWVGDAPAADVVIGGPPCQGFSTLGTRDPDDPRNGLWALYARAVAKASPKYFVLENVPPFLRSEQYEALLAATEPGGILSDYNISDTSFAVLASDFGAAQNRRRAVVVGHHRDLPAVDLDAVRSPARTVAEAFRGVPRRPHGKTLPARPATVKVLNGEIDTAGPFTTTELHVSRNYAAVSLERFQHIPAGGNRFDIPEHLLAPCWKTHTTGSADVMGRLHLDRPSVTIRTEFWKPEKGRYLHPTEDRAITHLEAARLQGFPDDFLWCGTKVAIGRQIGNAVPVQLAHAVARSIQIAMGDTAAAEEVRAA